MGPLGGFRIIEMAGVGPAPFAGMLLADMGAEVVRIDRPEPIDLGLPDQVEPRFEVLDRGRRSVAVDLKHEAGRTLALDLIARADALIEGFRPGVMERLGLGPGCCLERNPRLVFGRVTGFGQVGPLASRAGHDINYIALSGVLAAIGPGEDKPPAIPLNLVGDFGGGGMFLAFGVLAGLLSAARTGKGQVVDAAMVDGSALLMAMTYGYHSAGTWADRRASNALDGGAPWYGVYETADGLYMAVGAIEARFYATLIDRLGLAGEGLPAQNDRSGWPRLRARFAEVFRTRTRAAWEAHFAGHDACVTPVLSMAEAPAHPVNSARGVFLDQPGLTTPGPAPRFSATPAVAGEPSLGPGSDSRAVLADWGISPDRIARLIDCGVVGQS